MMTASFVNVERLIAERRAEGMELDAPTEEAKDTVRHLLEGARVITAADGRGLILVLKPKEGEWVAFHVGADGMVSCVNSNVLVP